MTQTFLEFINQNRPEDEKILLALRLYVAELTDDKIPSELRQDMVSGVTDASRVEPILAALKQDRGAQADAALCLFASQWQNPAEQERIVRAIKGANTKLPVIEAGLIALMAMYGMFLVTTGGRKSTKVRTIRNADGSIDSYEEVEYFAPTGPLDAVVALVRGRGNGAGEQKKQD